MSFRMLSRYVAVTAIAAIPLFFTAIPARAHCDSLDGPVVREARVALDKGDVTPILKWVTADDEAAIREAFDRTVAVRKSGVEAMALADQWFFETLVRVHRASEGESFTGLKPAGSVEEPALRMADQALELGSVDEMAKKFAAHTEQGLREMYARVTKAAAHKDESPELGREYVAAYVTWIHYAKNIAESIHSTGGHGHDTGVAHAGGHE